LVETDRLAKNALEAETADRLVMFEIVSWESVLPVNELQLGPLSAKSKALG
jgi:hypothetical protein